MTGKVFICFKSPILAVRFAMSKTLLKKSLLKKVKVNSDILSHLTTNGKQANGQRLRVQKTYKIYIDGKFPRTESGRYYKLNIKLAGSSKIGNNWAETH